MTTRLRALTLLLLALALVLPEPLAVSAEPPPTSTAREQHLGESARRPHLLLTTVQPATVSAPRHIVLAAAGIRERVRDLRCGIARLPNGRIWNWRCADPSNPTLLAHAWGSFRALSRAYDRGRLDRGTIMRVRGADGVTRRYRLAWTRIVRRERVDFWAFGATTVPSLTLITCRGRHSTHRLVVRFELVR